LAQTHFRKTVTRNLPHQNVLVTQMEVKTLYKQQILIYKTILKPFWTYGIQLWGTASTSNIEIIERFQSGRTLVFLKYGYPKGSPNANS
jgi:hypothetical protein